MESPCLAVNANIYGGKKQRHLWSVVRNAGYSADLQYFWREKFTVHHFLRIKPSTIFVWFVEQWGNQLICIFIAGTIGREQKLHLCLDGRTTWSIYNLLSVEHNRLLRHIKNYRYHLEKGDHAKGTGQCKIVVLLSSRKCSNVLRYTICRDTYFKILYSTVYEIVYVLCAFVK